jgi:chromosome segregation ATPase
MHMAEAERQIRQLYNDVNAIYGMLSELKDTQSSHGEELDSIKAHVITISSTQSRHGNRLNELDASVAGVSEQIKEMRTTQLRHENRFTEMDQRFDAHDAQFATQDRKLDLILEALNIAS